LLLSRKKRRVVRATWHLIDLKLGAFVRGECLLIVLVGTILSSSSTRSAFCTGSSSAPSPVSWRSFRSSVRSRRGARDRGRPHRVVAHGALRRPVRSRRAAHRRPPDRAARAG